MYCNSYACEQKKVVRKPNFCSNTGSFLTQNFCSKTEFFKFRDVRKLRFDCNQFYYLHMNFFNLGFSNQSSNLIVSKLNNFGKIIEYKKIV